MFRFIFNLFVILCVFLVGGLLIACFFPSSQHAITHVGGHPITWVFVAACGLAFATWRSLK